MTITAAAPSLVCEELPAVTVPVSVKRGPQLPERLERRVPPRPLVHAEDVRADAPSTEYGHVTGTISSANRPASAAAIAR